MAQLTREDIIKASILSSYKSVRKFSEEIGIPYSTIANIFSRGFESITIANAIKICRCLNLDLDALVDGQMKTRRNLTKESVWEKYCNGAMVETDKSGRGLNELFAQLNEEGQEKSIEYMADLVDSGKYKKNNQPGLVQKEA